MLRQVDHHAVRSSPSRVPKVMAMLTGEAAHPIGHRRRVLVLALQLRARVHLAVSAGMRVHAQQIAVVVDVRRGERCEITTAIAVVWVMSGSAAGQSVEDVPVLRSHQGTRPRR